MRKVSFIHIIGIIQIVLLAVLIFYINNLDQGLQKTNTRLSRITEPEPQGPQKVNLKTDSTAPFIGADTAKVEMVVFSDFQCGYCKTFALETLPKLRKDYIDKGLLKIYFRNLPLDIHKNAIAAAEAGACANEQNKFWEVHDAFFTNQDSLTKDFFNQKAISLGMDVSKFNACLQSKSYQTKIEKDIAEANNVGITGTPAIIINGNVTLGSRPYPYFKEIIDNELNK